MLISGALFAALGVALTVLVIVGSSWDFGVEPHSKAADSLFQFAMAIIAAPTAAGRLLGIPQNASVWLWIPLSALTNGVLCFLLGAYLGFLARLVIKPIPKTNDSAASYEGSSGKS
jgi:hypothetical protein